MLQRKPYSIHLFLICAISMMLAGIVTAQDEDTAAQIDAIVAASEARVMQELMLSDELMATITVYPCVDMDDGQEMSYERLDITDIRAEEITLVAEQLISCGGLGAYGLFITHVTEDASYVYFTEAREGSPDGLATGWTRPL